MYGHLSFELTCPPSPKPSSAPSLLLTPLESALIQVFILGNLKLFRMNTYKKHRGREVLLLTSLPNSVYRPNTVPRSPKSSARSINYHSLVPNRPPRLTHSASADTINSSLTEPGQGRPFPRRRTPMKLAYFDCFSGISGDMTLGALVDAGCDVEHLRAELHGLEVPGWELTAEKVWKNGMAATHVKVQTEDTHTHRSLSTILDIIAKSSLPPAVQQRASAIFRNLGVAEA